MTASIPEPTILEIQRQYREGFRVYEISRALGVPHATVTKWAKRSSAKRKDWRPPAPPRICSAEGCDNPARPNRATCGPACGRAVTAAGRAKAAEILAEGRSAAKQAADAAAITDRFVAALARSHVPSCGELGRVPHPGIPVWPRDEFDRLTGHRGNPITASSLADLA